MRTIFVTALAVTAFFGPGFTAAAQTYHVGKVSEIIEQDELFIGVLTKEGPSVSIGCATPSVSEKFYVMVGDVSLFLTVKKCLTTRPVCKDGIAFATESIDLTDAGDNRFTYVPGSRSCLDRLLMLQTELKKGSGKITVARDASGKYSLQAKVGK
jgi:hypothetical protein